MKIDFHTHGKLAKYLPFSKEYTHWLFAEARYAGLDAICLTEHFNTRGFAELYRYIADSFPREGDAYIVSGDKNSSLWEGDAYIVSGDKNSSLWEGDTHIVSADESSFLGKGDIRIVPNDKITFPGERNSYINEHLKIFPGMEVDIAEGGHTLVIGRMEDILAINLRLEPYKEKKHFLPMEQLVKIIREYPVLFGAAHPLREGGNIPGLPMELLNHFDFIDLNGKDVAEDERSARMKVDAFAGLLNIPLVAGSDTHQSFQYGSVYNIFTEDCSTVNSLGESIRRGTYEIHISRNAAFRVKTAVVLKRALKEIHALGGDYVSVLLKNNAD